MGTLAAYVLRRFLTTLASVLAIVFLLILLVDLVELMRRGANSDTPLPQILGLALLRVLPIAGNTLPFVFMLSAMACFARLARSSELVVTRAAGVSAWRLLAPVVLVAAVLGVAAFAVWNPISATALQRSETLEARYFRGQQSLLTVSREGLWLRQADETGQIVIRARTSNPAGTVLFAVTLFRFGAGERLEGRIEAGRAVLGDRVWRLYDVRQWSFSSGDDAPVETRHDTLDVPTDLTSDRILESFSSPDAIGFWDLPAYIQTLAQSGLSTLRYEMHYQAQLAKPLFFAAMVLIGAAFSMRHVRFGGVGVMLLGATMTGFLLFFASDITQALGASGAIPTQIAAWVPPSVAALLALGLLLQLEDG